MENSCSIFSQAPSERFNPFPLCDQVCDTAELFRAVIVKRHMEGNAGAKPWILLQKRLHFIRISGKDHDYVVTVVFHFLDNGIDRFIAVGTVPVVNQGVGFIDK